MPNSEKVSLLNKLFDSKLVVLGGAIIVVLFGVAVTKELLRRYEINKEITALEQQAAELESRQQELSGLIEYFQSDAFKEREARERLGLQREGESVVVLPNIESTQTGTIAGDRTIVSEQKNQSNMRKWWDYFFRESQS
ncbi:MAG: septum formation initiator family protein [Candidatus Kerfeldbacteria bacterium]|nr:septum formation initiator family protein [Candidatus Kerfeldbacteria bacterium]